MKSVVLLILVSLALFHAGCDTAPKTVSERDRLQSDSATSVTEMRSESPIVDDLLHSCYGYAIFPSVGKGGLIAGGSYGRGVVSEQGEMVGYADITAATIGGQVGAETFSELVIFQDQTALARFKSGKLSFETDLSAIALDASTATHPQYKHGVIVFVKPQGGLMAAAVVGGQQFSYQSKSGLPATVPAIQPDSMP